MGINFQKLRELCVIGDGIHTSIERQDSGVPYFTSKNFKPDGLDLTNVDYISESDYERYFIDKKSLLNPISQDIVFGIIGTIGTPYLVKPEDRFGISSSVAILRPKKKILPKYLYLYMSSHIFQSTVDIMKSGSAQGFLSLEMIGNLPIIAPDLRIQEKIAAILHTYDNLIEVNKLRIGILEKTIEELYKEWFVRSPKRKMIELEPGLPSSWGLVTVEELCKEIRKSVKLENLDSKQTYLGLEHLSRKSISLYKSSTTDSVSSNKLAFQKFDILFGKIRPYLHKVCIANFDGVCSTDILVIRPKDNIYLIYLLFTIFSDAFIDLANVSSKGTKMPRADWDFLKKTELRLPPKDILESFNEICMPRIDQIFIFLQQIKLLEGMKAALLPRLVSGELSIDDLDIQYPPSMQTSDEAEEK